MAPPIEEEKKTLENEKSLPNPVCECILPSPHAGAVGGLLGIHALQQPP
jgi:hypothetical protein